MTVQLKYCTAALNRAHVGRNEKVAAFRRLAHFGGVWRSHKPRTDAAIAESAGAVVALQLERLFNPRSSFAQCIASAHGRIAEYHDWDIALPSMHDDDHQQIGTPVGLGRSADDGQGSLGSGESRDIRLGR